MEAHDEGPRKRRGSRGNEEGPAVVSGPCRNASRWQALSLNRDDDAAVEGEEGLQGGVVVPVPGVAVGVHPHGAVRPEHGATGGVWPAEVVLVHVVVVLEDAPV